MKGLPRLLVRAMLLVVCGGGLPGCILYPRIPPIVYDTPEYKGHFVDAHGQSLPHLIVSWVGNPEVVDTTGNDGNAVLPAVRRFSPVGVLVLSMDPLDTYLTLLVKSEPGSYPVTVAIERPYGDSALRLGLRGLFFRRGRSFRTSIADTIVVPVSLP